MSLYPTLLSDISPQQRDNLRCHVWLSSDNRQIILSLLNAQTNLLKEDGKALEAIYESQSRIKSLSLIHENLYKSENFAQVNAQNYFRTLTDNIQKTFGNEDRKIEILDEIEEVSLKMSLAVPLGLILNELLTNAFKYAFEGTDTGRIKISFEKNAASPYYLLLINDNGVGIPQEIVKNSPDTFGLQLVQGLTEQMLGELEIRSTEGTEVKVLVKDIDMDDAA